MKVSNLIIGFTGYAKSGKDTAASAINAVLDQMGANVERLAFADPIRSVGELFGYTHEQMTDQSLKETYLGNDITGVTPRKFMQLVGSEMFRNSLDKDIWVRFMESRFENDPGSIGGEQLELGFGPDVWKPNRVYLITDVRFENEAEMIKKHGGLLIRINRPSMAPAGEWRKHESEAFIDTMKVDEDWYNGSNSAMEWAGEAIRQFSFLCKVHKLEFK